MSHSFTPSEKSFILAVIIMSFLYMTEDFMANKCTKLLLGISHIKGDLKTDNGDLSVYINLDDGDSRYMKY
jgi:hypothetical protein